MHDLRSDFCTHTIFVNMYAYVQLRHSLSYFVSLQDTDKILMDLSFDDGAYRGIKDAFPKANIAPKGSKGIYQNCKPRQSLCLISLKYGTIANERIIFRTKLGEHVNLSLNCRGNLVLTTAPVRLQLSVSNDDDDDVGEVALVNMREPESEVRSPTYQAVCEGLILSKCCVYCK